MPTSAATSRARLQLTSVQAIARCLSEGLVCIVGKSLFMRDLIERGDLNAERETAESVLSEPYAPSHAEAVRRGLVQGQIGIRDLVPCAQDDPRQPGCIQRPRLCGAGNDVFHDGPPIFPATSAGSAGQDASADDSIR